MPIYLHVFNLIISKKSITEKYLGGMNQFKEDFQFGISDVDQEDRDLCAIGAMGVPQTYIDMLVKNGLGFDEQSQFSNDFVLIYRYGDNFWKVDWLQHNHVFAWHTNTNATELNRAKEVGDMSIDTIDMLMQLGESPLKTIWIDE